MGIHEKPDRYKLGTRGEIKYLLELVDGKYRGIAPLLPSVTQAEAEEFIQFANLGESLTPQVDNKPNHSQTEK